MRYPRPKKHRKKIIIFKEFKISIFKEILKSKYGLDRGKILFSVQLMLIFCLYGWIGIRNGCAPFDFSKLMIYRRGLSEYS